MQRLHHASARHAILLIFQATDAAGKDGAFRHVMSGVNPQGCRVTVSNSPDEKSSMISSSARLAICRSAAGSRFSTGPTTRKCWSCVCITTFYTGRPSRTRRMTTRRLCGVSDIDQSTISKSTSTSTGPGRQSLSPPLEGGAADLWSSGWGMELEPDLKVYVLARRLRARRMQAREMKAGRVSARFS